MHKYQQIRAEIQYDLEQGTYKKGERIPSVRTLMRQYHCSRETILKALQQLKEQRYLYPIAKSGYYVLEDRQRLKPHRLSEVPHSQTLSLEDFRACLNESLLDVEAVFTEEGVAAQGDPALVHTLIPLFASYGVYAKAEQMVITTGTQQALYILLQMIGSSGILLEQPTYRRMNQLVAALRIPYQTIERTLDADGIDLRQLEALFASGTIQYFYTISRFHNPLGVSYTDTVKKRIIALAQQYQIYIIEDDYMADYETGQANPLHYFDTAERVIYVKSFSSILFSSFKIGGVVLPKPLVEQFIAIKQLLDYDSNLLMQKSLALYIENGMFQKHRQQMVDAYQRKEKNFKTQVPNEWLNKRIRGTQLLVTIEEFNSIRELLPTKITINKLDGVYLEKSEHDYLSLDMATVTTSELLKVVQTIQKGEQRDS